MNGEELPDSVRKGQRLTGMTSGMTSFSLSRLTIFFSEVWKIGSLDERIIALSIQNRR